MRLPQSRRKPCQLQFLFSHVKFLSEDEVFLAKTTNFSLLCRCIIIGCRKSMASKYFKNVEKLLSLSLWLCTDLSELSLFVEGLHSPNRYRFMCVYLTCLWRGCTFSVDATSPSRRPLDPPLTRAASACPTDAPPRLRKEEKTWSEMKKKSLRPAQIIFRWTDIPFQSSRCCHPGLSGSYKMLHPYILSWLLAQSNSPSVGPLIFCFLRIEALSTRRNSVWVSAIVEWVLYPFSCDTATSNVEKHDIVIDT